MAADGLYDFRYCTRCGDTDLLDRVTRLCPSCYVMAAAKRTAAPHYRVLPQTRQRRRPSSLRRKLGALVAATGVSFWAAFGMLPALLNAIGAERHTALLTPLKELLLAGGLFLFIVVSGWVSRALWRD